MWNRFLALLGRGVARFLEKPLHNYETYQPADLRALGRILKPADVVLVDGDSRFSVAIKYLTQSSWSHVMMYVGDAIDPPGPGQRCFVEVLVSEGCVGTSLEAYEGYGLRICRPVSLNDTERKMVVDFMVAKLGVQYDLRNIIDLARWLIPKPPIPLRWRRRMIAFGSGDPTRAICSSLIAQAFQSVRYPILPKIRKQDFRTADGRERVREVLHIRHHSLYAPRDFDLSPYFEIVKPTIAAGFDHRRLRWARPSEDEIPAERPKSLEAKQPERAMRTLVIAAAAAATIAAVASTALADTSAHDYTFTSIEGEPLPLEKYQGKALLVVNTASFCGYTYQYEGLQALWDRYRDRDFALLGVPSGDFGNQEYASSEEVKSFCEATFGIDFDMTEKNHVVRDEAHPFYAWVAGALGEEGVPRWNFHKILIGTDGRPVAGFSTRVDPQDPDLVAAIEAEITRAAE